MQQKPKKPKKTAQQVALEERQRSLLDEEIEESEERFKALARGRLGRGSLLSGAPRTRGQSARGTSRGGGGGAGSLLGGPVGGSGAGGGSISPGGGRVIN